MHDLSFLQLLISKWEIVAIRRIEEKRILCKLTKKLLNYDSIFSELVC